MIDSESAASVVIATKNRCDDLRRALASCFTQSVRVEVLVIDDGSTDGTSAMVRREFPNARLFTHAESAGYIVRRNQGARRAETPFVFSIDDDAEFTSATTIEQTLREFELPLIAAVAIPHLEPQLSSDIRHLAPDREQIWVTDSFKGTAYAVRKEVFLQLGGFRESLIHQGEESDFCIRLLNAEHFVRLGTADPITHYESPKRDLRRMDYYGPRNALLFVWQNVPFPACIGHLAAVTLRVLCLTLNPRRWFSRARGVLAAFTLFGGTSRESVSLSAYRRFRHLRQLHAIPLESVVAGP